MSLKRTTLSTQKNFLDLTKAQKNQVSKFGPTLSPNKYRID
jgi:hypothetical protein